MPFDLDDANNLAEVQPEMDEVAQTSEKTLEQFLDEVETPVENFEVPKTETSENSMFGTAPSADELELIQMANEFTSDSIVDGVNGVQQVVCSMIAGTGEMLDERFAVDSKAADRMKLLLKRMFPKDRKVMPDWLLLIIIVLITWSPNFVAAIQLRKVQKKLDETEKENERLQQENKRLRMKRKSKKDNDTDDDIEPEPSDDDSNEEV